MSFKTTIAMVSIFVLLISVYFLVFRDRSKTDSQEKYTISKAYGIEKGEVTKVSLEYKDESFEPFTLVRDDDRNWRFTEPIDAKADGKKIDKLLKDLLDRKIKRRLPKSDDFAKYGLEDPQIKYTVWTKDKSRKFLVGNKGISYSVYAKEAEEDSVITIEHTVLEYFSKSSADLRDRDIFDFQIDQVTQIALNYPERSIVCKRKPESREWEIVEPIQTEADFDEIDKFLSNLSELKVDVFERVENLETVRLEVTVSTEDSQTTLQIGDKLPEANRVYAKLVEAGLCPATPSVYSISEDVVAELTKTVYDLRDKQVLDFQRTDVNKFVIERSDVKITCEQDSKGEWSIVEPIKAKADKDSIDDFLFRLDALKAKEVLGKPKDLKKYGLDRPSITVMLYEIGEPVPVTLLVGTQRETSFATPIYVKSSSPEQVFLVENDILEEVGKKPSDFRDKA